VRWTTHIRVKWSYILCSRSRFSWRGHVPLFFDKVPAASAFKLLYERRRHHVCQPRRCLFTTLYGVTHQNAVIDAVSVADVFCSPHRLVL